MFNHSRHITDVSRSLPKQSVRRKIKMAAFPADNIDASIAFPDDTQSGESNFTDVKKWLEVPLATWYEVRGITSVRSKFGSSYIISLVDRFGVMQRYWSTKIIGEGVDRRLHENDTTKNVFIKSLGSRLNSNGTNTYYNYDIMLY